jgi:hypothetical protein
MENNTSSWKDIKKHFINGSLIIGNGASIELDEGFHYTSLLDVAKKNSFIDEQLINIFEQYNTVDFEYILRKLAKVINNTEPSKKNETYEKIKKQYDIVREALYLTIHIAHPDYSEVVNSSKNLEKNISFLLKFRILINLNYDLLIYFMINDHIRVNEMKDILSASETKSSIPAFNDCFGRKNEKLSFFKPRNGKKGGTFVFYPHGNLLLAIDEKTHSIFKIERAEKNVLIEINKKWKDAQNTPIIVCEGGSEEKLFSINKNLYTRFVFNEILSNLSNYFSNVSNSITILGWSLGENDDHILKQILKSKPEKIAISYYKDTSKNEDKAQQIKSAWEEIFKNSSQKPDKEPEIYFFPSQDVWNK